MLLRISYTKYHSHSNTPPAHPKGPRPPAGGGGGAHGIRVRPLRAGWEAIAELIDWFLMESAGFCQCRSNPARVRSDTRSSSTSTEM